MEVTREIIRTMNYVKESSYRTEVPDTHCRVYYERDKEYLNLDYSNLKCERSNINDENFAPIEENEKILSKKTKNNK